MSRNNAKYQTAKWLLAGALALVLVGVLIWQFSGIGRTDATAADGPARESESPTTATSNTRSSEPPLVATTVVVPTQWPQLELAQIVAHDPFAGNAPSGAAGAAADFDSTAELQRQQELADSLEVLRQRGVTMVLQTATGPVAAIGERTVSVGDKLGGYRVAEIDAHGIVLEPSPPK